MKKIKIVAFLFTLSLLLSSCFLLKAKDTACDILEGVDYVKGIWEDLTEKKSRGVAVINKPNAEFADVVEDEIAFYNSIDNVSFVTLPEVDDSLFKRIIDKFRGTICNEKEFPKLICNELRCVINQDGKSVTIFEIKDGKLETTNITGDFTNDALLQRVALTGSLFDIKDKVTN